MSVESVLSALEAVHGRAEWTPRGDPLGTLMACVLSQHTSDANTQRAFDRLRQRFASWNEVANAPTAGVEEAIRCGGLARSKAPRIQEILRRIRDRNGTFDLDCLGGMDDAAARDYLTGLPGVGPKTAAIVLCFALGRPVLPVDTHVFRVAWRLGLIQRRIGEARAHNALGARVPPPLVYRFHMALLRHGRTVCRARAPRCHDCPLASRCAHPGP